MLNSRALSFSMDETYEINKFIPFAAALGFHIFLAIWDPTILKAGSYTMQTPTITVKIMDHLPVMGQPKRMAPKPVVKKVEKKPPVHKAKKSGLSHTFHAHPIAVTRHPMMAIKHSAPKPFVSKITMPKFVPHEADEPIAASPLPGVAPAAQHRAVNAFATPKPLTGKTRGVRAQDIPFQLADREGVSAGGTIVAIPIGEERGETAALASAPTIHDAPKARVGSPGYHYEPGQGSGSGELAGHDKSGSGKIGSYGLVKADAFTEGSLSGMSGNGKGKVVTGKGFEIGGPVGDRRISHRQLPKYPDWAEEKGITAIVKIYFTVRPDGTIRSAMRILQSSGYTELDDLAREALGQWHFSATSADSSTQAAWGVITFRYTLA